MARRLVATGLLAAAFALTGPGAGAQSPSVPPQYQALYDGVAGQVASFGQQAGAAAAPRHPHTVLGTELLGANGNIGTSLLLPSALVEVESELHAFAALHVSGVTVDVSFPLLADGTPGHAGYLRFYEEVAAQVKARHMVLSVEENPVYVGTPLTTLPVSYAGLTPSTYAAEQRAQAQQIIDDLHPAYLSLITEPDTYTDALGIPLDSAAAIVSVVRRELDGLRREGTKVGAGTGTWSSPAIDAALLRQTSIDYLDVHVYPLGPTEVTNLEADTSTAQHAHRPLVMDETWLNKPLGEEAAGPAGAPAELKVKSFSFWEPLDARYVTAMANYVESEHYAYVSFFDGSRAFFGYLPWSTQLQQASYQSFSRQYDALVGANMRSGSITASGQAFQQAAAP